MASEKRKRARKKDLCEPKKGKEEKKTKRKKKELPCVLLSHIFTFCSVYEHACLGCTSTYMKIISNTKSSSLLELHIGTLDILQYAQKNMIGIKKILYLDYSLGRNIIESTLSMKIFTKVEHLTTYFVSSLLDHLDDLSNLESLRILSIGHDFPPTKHGFSFCKLQKLSVLVIEQNWRILWLHHLPCSLVQLVVVGDIHDDGNPAYFSLGHFTHLTEIKTFLMHIDAYTRTFTSHLALLVGAFPQIKYTHTSTNTTASKIYPNLTSLRCQCREPITDFFSTLVLHMPQLQTLDINFHDIDTLRCPLPSTLTQLSLMNTCKEMEFDIKYIAILSDLVVLELSGAPRGNTVDYRSLSALHKLRALEIDGEDLSPDRLPTLLNLEWLCLSGRSPTHGNSNGNWDWSAARFPFDRLFPNLVCFTPLEGAIVYADTTMFPIFSDKLRVYDIRMMYDQDMDEREMKAIEKLLFSSSSLTTLYIDSPDQFLKEFRLLKTASNQIISCRPPHELLSRSVVLGRFSQFVRFRSLGFSF